MLVSVMPEPALLYLIQLPADVASAERDNAQLAFTLLDVHGAFKLGWTNSAGLKAVDRFDIQHALDAVQRGPFRSFILDLLPQELFH